MENIAAADLRDFQLVELQESETPQMAHLWSWSQALLLEDAAAMVTFEQAGVPIQVMCNLIGETAWKTMFPAAVSTTDAVPFQLRQLMVYQMQSISNKLQEKEFEAARKAGQEAMKTTAQVVRAETVRIKKAKGSSKSVASTIRKTAA